MTTYKSKECPMSDLLKQIDELSTALEAASEKAEGAIKQEVTSLCKESFILGYKVAQARIEAGGKEPTTKEWLQAKQDLGLE